MINPSQGATFQGKSNSETNGDGDGNQEQNSSPRRRDLMAGSRPKPIVPKSLSEAYRIAQAVCAAKMAPKGLDTPEACMIAIMHGLELGLSPLSALQRIAVINGRPTIWGDGALAVVKASGLCEAIEEWIEGDKPETWNAVCNVIRRGDIIPVERRFTVEDAKRAKLWGKPGPWSDYPKRMLQMRARAFALRDAFPDVLGGLYLTEEWITDRESAIEAPSAGSAATLAGQAQKAERQAEFIHERSVKTHPHYDDRAKPDSVEGAKTESVEGAKPEIIEETKAERDERANIERHSPTNQYREEGYHKSSSLLDAKLPPLANLRRARRMPRSTLALRFRKQWSIKQPKHPASSGCTSDADSATLMVSDNVHSPEPRGVFLVECRDSHSPSFIPPSDYEACLDLFDAALCCANDPESLIEVAEEFAERLNSLPQEQRHRSEQIFARHAFRIEHAVAEQSPSGIKTTSIGARAIATEAQSAEHHEDVP